MIAQLSNLSRSLLRASAPSLELTEQLHPVWYRLDWYPSLLRDIPFGSLGQLFGSLGQFLPTALAEPLCRQQSAGGLLWLLLHSLFATIFPSWGLELSSLGACCCRAEGAEPPPVAGDLFPFLSTVGPGAIDESASWC